MSKIRAKLSKINTELLRIQEGITSSQPEDPPRFVRGLLTDSSGQFFDPISEKVFIVWFAGYRDGRNHKEIIMNKEKLELFGGLGKLTLILSFLLSIAVVLAGVYMIYVGTQGRSVIRIFNQTIETDVAGLACAFVGVVGMVVVVSTIFRAVRKS